MIHLVEIDESNWLAALRLSVADDQKGFLASPEGILARGYVYRGSRARVWGIAADDAGGELVGLALVRDLDEEPACYELQQFMIDAGQQNKGYGGAALRRILELLAAEGKYPCVEVCVKRAASAARRVYERAGFVDTGYIDPDLPDSLNLRHTFGKER